MGKMGLHPLQNLEGRLYFKVEAGVVQDHELLVYNCLLQHLQILAYELVIFPKIE